MQAGRAAGTEKSGLRESMCAGTWLPQSCVSPKGVLGAEHVRSKPRKIMTFQLKNCGFLISIVFQLISHVATACIVHFFNVQMKGKCDFSDLFDMK